MPERIATLVRSPCLTTNPPPDGRVEATGSDIPMTTKHTYFSGNRKKFRVRYDRIMSLDPYEDGLSIMRDARRPSPRPSAPATAGSPTNWPWKPITRRNFTQGSDRR